MRKRPKPFLGHEITRQDISTIASLALFLGLRKRAVKTEDELWKATERVYGLRPEPGEPFIKAVRRIRGKIGAMTQDARRAAKVAAGVADVTPSASNVVAFKRPKSKGKGKPSADTKEAFYRSWEWRTARMEVLKRHARRCMCCGSTPEDVTVDGKPVRLVVDHIKPVSKYWHLRLVPTNLQVLCDECNMGKGAWDETDHRSESERLIAEQLRYEVV